MIESNEYVISIHADGAALEKLESIDAEATAPEAVAQTNNGQSVQSHKISKKELNKKLAPLAFAYTAAKTIVNVSSNRVALRTGHQSYQEKIQYCVSVAEQAIDIGASIAFGAITGGVGGAVIGAATAVTKQAINAMIAAQELAIKRSVEGIGIRQANVRAGIPRGTGDGGLTY